MKHPLLDLLSASLVPELRADVAASPSRDIHLILIAVAAVGALPEELAALLNDRDLAVVAAYLAVVALCVELCVHDVVVNKPHDLQNSREVILHIGHLNVADRAAGRQSLELGLELELVERADVFGHMNMVAVCDVVAVGNALDDTEALLQALGELVGSALERSAVDAVVDVLLSLPLSARLVELLHDLQSKLLALGLGELFAVEAVNTFPKSGVAERNGGVSAVKELVDRLALFKTGERAVLPEDGSGVGQSALQPFVTRAEGAVTELHALVKDAPELCHVAVCRETDIYEVYGDNALIESAVVFVLTGNVVARVSDIANAGVGKAVGCEERTAAHAGVYVALELEHYLLRNVVGNHALSGALCRQLREVPVFAVLGNIVLLKHVDELGERRGDPYALFVFDALIALLERLLDYHGEVGLFLLVLRLVKIHIYGYKRSLTVCCQQSDYLILDSLNALVDLVAKPLLNNGVELVVGHLNAHFLDLGAGLAADLLPRDLNERSEVGKADALTAVLVARYLSDDLGRDVARGRKAVGLLDKGIADHGSVLEHILEIYEVAVVHMLGKIVGIVEVDYALLIGLDNVGREQHSLCKVAAHLACHVVALNAVDSGVLVGIFLLNLLVVALDQREDAVIGGVRLADKRAVVAVSYIPSGKLERALCHKLILDHILDLLYRYRALHLVALVLDIVGDIKDLLLGQKRCVRRIVRLSYGVDYLFNVKIFFRAVTLYDFHICPSLRFYINFKIYSRI